MSVSDLGQTQLKNIAEPVRVYSVEVGKPAGRPRPRRSCVRRLVPALVALAAVLVVAGAVAWNFVASKPWTAATSSAAPKSSSFGPAVAVLPFANATGDAKNDVLALRLGQKTTDYLGKYGWLRAIGRPGGAAKSVADPIAAARELGADYVVTAEVDFGRGFPARDVPCRRCAFGRAPLVADACADSRRPEVRRRRGRNRGARGSADAAGDSQRRADAGKDEDGRRANHLRLRHPGPLGTIPMQRGGRATASRPRRKKSP